MNSILLAALGTVGFFAAVGLFVGWAVVAAHIENEVVSFLVLFVPLVVMVFVLAYFTLETL